MRAYPLDAVERARPRQQVLPDVEHQLAADGDLRLDERVEALRDGSLGGVLHGNDAVVGASALAEVEHLGDVRRRDEVGQRPELTDGRLVTERALGSEERDAHHLFERPRRRDDLAEDVRDALFGERSRIRRRETGDQVALARRDVDGGAAVARLELTDLLHETRAQVQAIEQLAIDLVDRRAQSPRARPGNSGSSSPASRTSRPLPSGRSAFVASALRSSDIDTRSRPEWFGGHANRASATRPRDAGGGARHSGYEDLARVAGEIGVGLPARFDLVPGPDPPRESIDSYRRGGIGANPAKKLAQDTRAPAASQTRIGQFGSGDKELSEAARAGPRPTAQRRRANSPETLRLQPTRTGCRRGPAGARLPRRHETGGITNIVVISTHS